MAREERPNVGTDAWLKEIQNRLEAIGTRLADVGQWFERSAKARELAGRDIRSVLELIDQLDERLARVCTESGGSADRSDPVDRVNVAYRDVPDFPGYRVGDDGTVWGCRRAGRGYGRSREWRALKPYLVRPGPMPTVSLYRDRVRHSRRVDAIVMLSFHGPCPPGCEVEHLNGDVLDNRLANLRYAPASESP